jgi:hypothetical protein
MLNLKSITKVTAVKSIKRFLIVFVSAGLAGIVAANIIFPDTFSEESFQKYLLLTVSAFMTSGIAAILKMASGIKDYPPEATKEAEEAEKDVPIG